MQIVIPMAGAGQRFQDAGYTTPKPLLDVDGVPMIVRVVNDLPAATRIVFVVNRDHIVQSKIDDTLLHYFPSSKIVVAPGLTEGQACSVQLGCRDLNPNEDVLVAACDNTHVFDGKRFAELRKRAKADSLIWTYRNEPRVLVNPNWYGWVSVDEQDRVNDVSVKVPLSDTPLNDHVVSGAFWFRSARLLSAGIRQLVKQDVRVNGEFYLDSVPSIILRDGYDVRVFEVDKYIGWGTPGDYEDYKKWSAYVRRGIDRSAA